MTALATAALALALTASSAAAAGQDEEDRGEPSEAMLARSVRAFDGGVRTFDPVVTSLGSNTTEGEETVITLAADILFTPDSWDLPGSATDRIEALLEDIPDGAVVRVHGHTDSVDGAVENQLLSENRAGAVAEVIASVRPDLVLEEAGFADTRPVVTEVPGDPSTRTANRRVEIRYES